MSTAGKIIPQKIHYCWFGEEPLPEFAKLCINSWKKFCPEYKIIEWNEKNFDLESSCEYVKEALKLKKWAFISDYARFEILYNHGGLYFDTDVEIIKPLNPILLQGPFMGFETNAGTGKGTVAPGLGLAAYPSMEIYCEILEFYKSRHLIKQDGSIDLTTVVVFVTEILRKHGLKDVSGIQEISGIRIYPSEYFCPMDYSTGLIDISENTYTIHHYSETWLDSITKIIHLLQRSINRIFGKNFGKIIGDVIIIPLKVVRKTMYFFRAIPTYK